MSFKKVFLIMCLSLDSTASVVVQRYKRIRQHLCRLTDQHGISFSQLKVLDARLPSEFRNENSKLNCAFDQGLNSCCLIYLCPNAKHFSHIRIAGQDSLLKKL